MKQLIITIGFILTTYFSGAQDMIIETESVTIDNLIPFIVEKVEPEDSNSPKHFTFLLQTSLSGISKDDKVILKQAFKLLSDRLSEEDYISLLTYSGFSGTALSKSSPKDLKTISFTIEHLKSSVEVLHKNGIEHAYNYAEAHYLVDGINSVVMIRNPKAGRSTEASLTTQDKTKSNGNVALITAIALLPELISVIKD